ncbi:MAG: glycosyltransferase family 2 protein [Treponema sp.]|nr:glycosyltransferase family 2 protein [Treponema sp.]
MEGTKLLIIIPTYNEAENIGLLIESLFKLTLPPEIDLNILIIDDSSPDGTGDLAKSLVPSYPGKLQVEIRPGKQGGASAFLRGFSRGLEEGYDLFLAMDADFSHNPVYIPRMLEEIKTHDLVIGSRNVKGGSIENRSFLRDLITKAAALYCRICLGCPLRDFTAGFNLYRKVIFQAIKPESIICRAYSFQIEIKYKVFCQGFRIKEIPIMFPDRLRGVSKMSRKFLFDALFDVWKIKKMKSRDTPLDQFIMFAITGGLGTISNLVLFFFFADLLAISANPVSIGCFLIAGTQNYILNHRWSFRQLTGGEKPSVKKWLLFLAAATGGLSINLIILNSMLHFFDLPYKFIAQAVGILAGMLINYSLAKYMVFRKKKTLSPH